MPLTKRQCLMSSGEDGPVPHLLPWTAVLAAVLAAGVAAAGEGVFSGSVEVNVVNLRVVVTDLLGRPVAGLERDEFVVFEDGQRQRISHFARFDGPGSLGDGGEEGAGGLGEARAALVPGSAPPPHLVVLAFDLGSIWKPRLRWAVDGSRDLVLAQSSPAVEWSVVAVGRETVCLVPPTSNVGRVMEGLERVMTSPAAGVPLRVAQAGRLLDLPGLRGLSCRLAVDPRAAALRDTLNGLEATFLSHASRRGSKSCVYLYQGEDDSRPGCAGVDLSADATVRVSGVASGVTEVARQAATCGFTVYATDVSGLREPPLVPGGRLLDASSPGRILASVTGGGHFASNTHGHAFRAAVRESHRHYSIGYTRDRSHDGEPHRLEVRVPGRPFLVVRHVSEVYDLDPRLLLAQQLTAPVPVLTDQGAIPVRLDLSSWTLADQVEVEVDASVPADELALLPAGDGFAANLHLFVAVHGEDGQLVALRETEERIVLPEAEARRGGGRVGRRFTLRLPAAVQTITVAVYDRTSGLTGLATRLVVPSAPAGHV